MSPVQFKICPRCNSRVSEDKNVCQQCGAIVKDSPPLAREEDSGKGDGANGSPSKRYCPICAKVPDEAVTCPNCGVPDLCKWHLYKFFGDNDKSPVGCPKCGPRCAVCGIQAALVRVNQRAVCTSCQSVLMSSEAVKEGINRRGFYKAMQILSVVITVAGLLAGYIFGNDPHFIKYVTGLIGAKVPVLYIHIGAASVGLVIGSFIGAIINNLFRPS